MLSRRELAPAPLPSIRIAKRSDWGMRFRPPPLLPYADLHMQDLDGNGCSSIAAICGLLRRSSPEANSNPESCHVLRAMVPIRGGRCGRMKNLILASVRCEYSAQACAVAIALTPWQPWMLTNSLNTRYTRHGLLKACTRWIG